MEEKRFCVCCGEEKPVSMFYRNAWGYTNYCSECHNKRAIAGREKKKALANLQADVEKAKMMRLSDFTPRELMMRLKELGYDGELTYTKVERINISKL
jgi:hypothetical protein